MENLLVPLHEFHLNGCISMLYLEMDRISNLPRGILETILCYLPIEEAARTSVLAPEWRYRWINIPTLVFTWLWALEPPMSETMWMIKRWKLFNAITQILLTHQGPLREFTLSMATDGTFHEIDNIINHLSTIISLQKLNLDLTWYTPPLSLFSMHQLRHLYLCGCDLNHQPPFIGFTRLTTLLLDEVIMNDKALINLLSHCPLLKNLEVDYAPSIFGEKLSIVKLFECLPMIENLSILFNHFECFAANRFLRQLPTALLHLKFLWLKEISSTNHGRSTIISLLLRSSPNLQKLWIDVLEEDEESDERIGALTYDEYSDIWLEHLNEFQIKYSVLKMSRFEFVKLILARSPVLKKVKIFLPSDATKNDTYDIASPAVDIVVEVKSGFFPSFSENLIM